MPRVTSLCVLFLLCLAGCGGQSPPSLTGTWTFSLISTAVPSEPPETLTGALTSDGSNVTGTLVFSDKCFAGQMLQFTGNLQELYTLKLYSTTYNNQNIYVTGTVSQDGSYMTAGTYTVTPENTTQPACAGNVSGTATGKRTATTTSEAGARGPA